MKKIKKIVLIISCIIVFILGVLFVKYLLLVKEKEVPYSNLTKFDSGFYYIYCDIKYKDQKYTIVTSNTQLFYFFINEKNKLFSFTPFYSLWMQLFIKNDLPVKVNDHMFSVLKNDIVKKEFVRKHESLLTKENIIMNKGKMPDNLSIDDFNAIIYILLQNGINCRTYSETGGTEIILPVERRL